MRNSRILKLAGVSAFALFLAACGPGDTPTPAEPPAAPEVPATLPAEIPPGTDLAEGAAHLTIWADDTRYAPVRAAADSYIAANPGVTIDVVEKNFEDIRPDFNAQVPTGAGPDITVCAHDWLGELVANGVVAPITLGAAQAAFEPVAIGAFTWDGQVYAVPYAIENIGLLRNTDLAPNAPATWDEMLAMSEAAGSQFPVLLQTTSEGDPFHFYPLQTSFGAPVFTQNPDGSYTNQLGLGGENGEAFANWLSEQGAAGVLSTDIDWNIVVQNFADGNSPFWITGPWGPTQDAVAAANLNLAVDPIPRPGSYNASPFVGVQGFCLSSQSDNALLANDFLVNYIGTNDVQLALAAAGGRPPALTAAQAAAFAADESGLMEGFARVGADGVPMPNIPEMGEVWAFWGVTQADIIEGAPDPAGRWDQMVQDIQGAID